jgi:Na+/H+-dicarboxylate symporter
VLARLRRVPFAAQVLLALAVGVALGLVARAVGPVADGSPNWLTSTLDTVGHTFVALLRVIVVPLIVTAVIVSIANLKQVSNAARLAVRTLLWFAVTALIAVSIGIGLGLLTHPGRNSSVDAAAAEVPGTTARGGTSSPAWCRATSSACRPPRTTTGRSACPSTCCS